jgi:hypothetical protein
MSNDASFCLDQLSGSSVITSVVSFSHLSLQITVSIWIWNETPTTPSQAHQRHDSA